MAEREELEILLKERYGLNGRQIGDVLEHAYTLSEGRDKPNEFAKAKGLNDLADTIVSLVAEGKKLLGWNATLEITELNRAYIFIVEELDKLTIRNAELKAIKARPIWQYYDSLKGSENAINQHFNDTFSGADDIGDYANQLERLCIVNHAEDPKYTNNQNEIIDSATKAIKDYRTELNKTKLTLEKENKDWFIPEYTFDITPDGKLLVNGVEGVMKVRTVQAGSVNEMALTQAKIRPNELFKPDLKAHSTKRGLRTSLREIGFDNEVIQKLFMPVMDNRRGIQFRPSVSVSDARKENIDTNELDNILVEKGVQTEINPQNIPF